MALDLSKVSEVYFNKLFKQQGNQDVMEDIKARVLLVDKYSTPIISMSYSQSELLQNDIILIELIDKQKDLNSMKHLNCIVYIKATKESIESLIAELKNPHFNSYNVYFNNTISKAQLEQIAEGDEFEVVNSLVELFQDYQIVNHNLYQINISQSSNRILEESNSITSLLLALRKCPIIKYEHSSLELKKLSSEILYNINSNSNNNLFDDLNKHSDTAPVLLLLDRKNDPITPLISPWTYQSMIHELVGINKNIVNLRESKEQLTLSESDDKFFRESMYLNYGDLTDHFQKYVEEYKKQTKQSSIENLKTQNLTDLKKMLTRFPEFKKLSNNILKHLNLISELDKQISAQDLWTIGELQQVIICELENHLSIKASMLQVFDNAQVPTLQKINLLLLYSIRFDNESDLALFVNKLNDPTLTKPLPSMSQSLLIKKFKKIFKSKISGNLNSHNSNNLGSIFNKKKININLLFNNENSNKTDNVYMQYTPKLNEVLNTLISPVRGKEDMLSTLSTLVPENIKNQYGKSLNNMPYQDIIIYIKGGVTYEEARLIHEMSSSNDKINLVIGGDKIINSKIWLEDLYDLVNHDSASQGESNGPSTSIDRKAQLDLL